MPNEYSVEVRREARRLWIGRRDRVARRRHGVRRSVLVAGSARAHVEGLAREAVALRRVVVAEEPPVRQADVPAEHAQKFVARARKQPMRTGLKQTLIS